MQNGANGGHGRTAGFSLVEVLVAMFLATLVFLSLAQLLGLGVEVGRAASDMTRAGALAGERLEELSQTDYANFVPGGSTAMNVGGFFDLHDVDADGVNDYLRRWEVTDLGNAMRLRVRVIALIDLIGPAKEANYVALIADK